MKLSVAVKPISYLKAHASEVIREVVEKQQTLVITHNGEAKVIVQDMHVYEQAQESMALLKMLLQGKKSQEAGRVKTIDAACESVLHRARPARKK